MCEKETSLPEISKLPKNVKLQVTQVTKAWLTVRVKSVVEIAGCSLSDDGIIAGRECHADDRLASREPIQLVRVDVLQLLRIGHPAPVSRGSHPDLRGGGRYPAVQYAAREGADPKADSVLLAGGQRFALEGRLSR